MRQAPFTIHSFKQKKEKKEKITMMTCYDYPSARLISESPIDCVLVGDSVAMVVHGHSSTIHATMPMMTLHTQAVARGLHSTFLISDLPFLSYRSDLADTVKHVRNLMQAGAHAIKLEGADPHALQTIQHLVTSGIPIMGHIGLTPQSVHQLGGYKVQGKQHSDAERLLQEAQRLEESGCFAIVLECMPRHLANTITQHINIPTIGIGAGPDTDGQVLVWHDLLGLHSDYLPKFVKQFMPGKTSILSAIHDYVEEVATSQFPAMEHTYP